MARASLRRAESGSCIASRQPEQETPVRIKRHPFHICTLAWSPDSQQIASASAEETAHIWQPPAPE